MAFPRRPFVVMPVANYMLGVFAKIERGIRRDAEIPESPVEHHLFVSVEHLIGVFTDVSYIMSY